MAFNWLNFFEQHRIPFDSSGRNVSRNHVVIHCPFCGRADPSKHMSVEVDGRGWHCWRDPKHVGKSPARLVAALLHVPNERAREIVGQSIFIPDDFLGRVRGMFDSKKDKEPGALQIPSDFKSFGNDLPSRRPFARYLQRRGFVEKQIDKLTKRYDAYYCTRGPYKGRIVFVIKQGGRVVAWTGRTIHADVDLRYKALSTNPESAEREGLKPALGAISHYLLWYDRLVSSDLDHLVICEGPFDALKVSVLGRRYGIGATCFFTSAPTNRQIDLLHELCPKFSTRTLLLDSKTLAIGIRTVSRLSGLGVRLGSLPDGVDDPGEFDPVSFSKFRVAHGLHAA